MYSDKGAKKEKTTIARDKTTCKVPTAVTPLINQGACICDASAGDQLPTLLGPPNSHDPISAMPIGATPRPGPTFIL
jgi:hypothetical protein